MKIEFTTTPKTAGSIVLKVIMDNKICGNIKKVSGGYQYFPVGSKHGGDILPTIEQVKNSLL